MSEAKAEHNAPDAPSASASAAATTVPTVPALAEHGAVGSISETELLPDEPGTGAENDSLKGESIASSSTSVHTSVRQYREENGRTYHSYKEGKYIMPNDERENERLDVQHNMFILAFDGRLGTSPPNDPKSKVGRVLDVGTGTGVWAMDFGEDHPEAEVIGIDLSPIQPNFTHSNVKFEVDDIEEEWNYSQPFDYIHSRMMTLSIKSWKEYIKKCYDNLNPGGYLELNEIDLQPRSDDGTLQEDCSLLKFARLWGEAAAMFGRPFLSDLSVLREVMTEVGFEGVSAQKFKWPSNPWARDKKHKELGHWNLDNSVANLEGFMMAPFTRAHHWTEEEVIVFAMQLVDLRKKALCCLT
ncbi:hypothetical protein CkaCkLH20_02148 [Colletotrichum karsti]|uniref:Secondary metabolism regulator LAE1 n=1 Tax=Colletotrichum karsti TaxID=1095194 RepID=A0A9P6ICY8_9PEZI|nr:uncharacterized protein CkaCkLH20_02148 [Colletotrichum karsti]KAF9880194.1 hypothetical protein CkaCkLH20_02148 [Colletotrichum karsti]